MTRPVVGMMALIVALMVATPAWADYAAGQRAWEAGRLTEAVAEWEGAASEGDAGAMMALGHVYRRGVGAPQDFVLAHMWFNLAASRGDEAALKERNDLAAHMTPSATAEAQKLAREWRAAARPAAKAEEPTPATNEAESAAGPPPPQAIKEAQSLLAQLGYAPGPADGIWGRRTTEAFQAFLRDAGLPMANALTPATLRTMREIAASQGEAERPTQTAAAQQLADGLHQAAKAGDIDGLNAALATGEEVNARDNQGWTALMHAANKGYTLLVASLLEAKADPDVQAADGATALFMAAVHGHSEIIGLLMNAGADYSIKGPKDRTAADVARVKYGGLDAAERNNERAEVLALVQRGEPTIVELADRIEIAKSSVEDNLSKCEGKFRYVGDSHTRYTLRVTAARFLETSIEIDVEVRYSDSKNDFRGTFTEESAFDIHKVQAKAYSPDEAQKEGILSAFGVLSFEGRVDVETFNDGVSSSRETQDRMMVLCKWGLISKIVEDIRQMKRAKNEIDRLKRS